MPPPMLTLKGARMLGFRLPRPDGLPDSDSPTSRMVRGLAISERFEGLDAAEREALFLSLSLALDRAQYHSERFREIVQILEDRFTTVGGFGVYDLFSQYTLFEAGAALGAVRLGIDELIFIAARVQGVAAAEIHQRWKASRVLTAGFDKMPELDIAVVHALREVRDWYEELNDYRNVLHHRGWRSQSAAYYPIDSRLAEARDSSTNVMLVPDRGSLAGQTRPHQWSYSESRRLEPIVERAVAGFQELVEKVCLDVWGGTVPAPGTMPEAQHPNVLVGLPRPILFSSRENALLPVFGERELALNFDEIRYRKNADLVMISPTSLVVGEPAFCLSLSGLRDMAISQSLSGDLVISINPSQVADAERGSEKIALNEEFFRAVEENPISLLEATIGSSRLFFWRIWPSV